MIQFQCEHCAVKLSVREDRAGAIGRCPRCKQAITIPRPSPPKTPEPADEEELTLIAPPERKDPAPFDQPDEKELAEKEEERRRQERILLTQVGIQPQPEHTGERQFAWPIDILLYPTSGPALVVLGLITGIPLLLELIEHLIPAIRSVGLVFFLIGAVMGLCALWYLVECIYDSAKGGTRAPDFEMVSLGDMWSRVSYLIAIYIVYLFPAMLYRIVIDGFEITGTQFEIIYWVLVVWAWIFLPIGLLRMVIDDSFSALNPLGLLGSIFRALPQYTALLLLFAAVAALLWWTGQDSSEEPVQRSFWMEAVGLLVANYGAFVAAHVLGRFYWRNRERLDWGL